MKSKRELDRHVPTPNKPFEKLNGDHTLRYMFATQRVDGAVVLDDGCGCGYRSKYLADNGALSISVIRDRNKATPNEVVHNAPTYTKFLTDHKFIITEVRSWHPARLLRIKSIFDLLIVTRELLFETTGMLPQPCCDNRLLIVATKP